AAALRHLPRGARRVAGPRLPDRSGLRPARGLPDAGAARRAVERRAPGAVRPRGAVPSRSADLGDLDNGVGRSRTRRGAALDPRGTKPPPPPTTPGHRARRVVRGPHAAGLAERDRQARPRSSGRLDHTGGSLVEEAVERGEDLAVAVLRVARELGF